MKIIEGPKLCLLDHINNISEHLVNTYHNN